MPSKITVFMALFCASLQAQPVGYNQEFRINTYTESEQRGACVSYLSNGGFVVCWVSRYQDGSEDGIFGQIYDSNRSKIGEEFQINTSTYRFQINPSVCSLSDGGFLVCWRSNHQDYDSYNIYAQVFDNIGTKVGDEFMVNSHESAWMPCVAGLSNGGFVICWYYTIYENGTNGVYGQIYKNNTEKYGEEIHMNTYTDGNQFDPSVCGLSDGGFVVCWSSENQDGDKSGIFGQIYDSTGNIRGSEFQVNTYTNSYQLAPDVCKLSDFGFIVCWNSWGQDGSNQGVFAQIFNNDGLKQGGEFQVNTYTNSDQQSRSVCELANGGFIICWNSWGQDGSGTGIFGQVYDNNNMKLGKEFQVNDYASGNQWSPTVSGSTNRDFMVCWDNWSEVYGKYLRKPIIHQLQPFALISPEHDATLKSKTVVFLWNQASSGQIVFPLEMEYKIYLDTNTDFYDPEIFTDIYDTTYSVEGLSTSQTYFWKILAKNIEGDSLWSSETFGFYFNPDATQIIQDLLSEAQEFKLFKNYPNPFNPATTIEFNLPITGEVTLKIFNVLGEEVVTLVSGRLSAGSYTYKWDASNMASGVYLCRLEAEGFVETKKMILIR
jgi:hypothetical protein